MAKVNSIIELKGTIGGLNFYKRKGVLLARTAGGGFNGEAIKTKASITRVRENGSEFKDCMQTVQFFKQGLQPFLGTFKDGTLQQRLVSLFTQIKKLDAVAARGSRTVFGGLQTAAGQGLLNPYLLTSGSRLADLLRQKATFEWETGLSLPDFEGQQVSFPSGATHLSLQIGYLSLDFAQHSFSFGSSDTIYLSPSDAGTVVLSAPAPVAKEGMQLSVVLARFVQEVNGQFYALKSEGSVVMEVVGCQL